jgi:hypothetical protein
MKAKFKFTGIIIALCCTLAFVHNAAARDLIVVATKTTQNNSLDWLGFLESKEIPVKRITPESFSGYKGELYIIVLGSLDEKNGVVEIAKDALTADEFKTLEESGKGKMFYKPQAWNVGQKVILFLGPNQESVKEARKSTRDDWFEMLKEWFDIEETEGFHVY